MEPKDYSIKYSIVNDIMSSLKTGLIPNVTIPNCGGRVTGPAQSREELILKHKSRMNNLY